MTTGSTPTRATPASLLPIASALAVAAGAWFASNQDGLFGPLVLGWVAPPASLAVGAYALRRTAAAAGMPPAAARFWRQISLVANLSAVGMVVQAVYALTGLGPAPAKVPLPAGIFFVAAVMFAVWALLLVPADARTAAEWARLSLDGATAVLGAAVFVWYVGLGPLLSTHRLPAAWAPLSVGMVCLVGFAAIIKIALAGAGPIDARALWVLGSALLVGGVSAGTATLIANQPYLVPAQVSVPLIGLLLVLAADARPVRSARRCRRRCAGWRSWPPSCRTSR